MIMSDREDDSATIIHIARGERMPATRQKLYTVEYIRALPEGKRAELIDGIVYDLAAPSRIHQRISMMLSRVIASHIESKGLPCDVYAAPFAVFLDDYNYLEPDLSVICDQNKLSDRGCEGAPDWIIEIVAPASQRMDYMIKLNKYRAAGVGLYWIVDPDLAAVIVHDFAHEQMQRYRFTDDIPVGLCDDLVIRLAGYDR